jgi:hypothetical protein
MIELLTVMGLISVLAGVSLPAIKGVTGSRSLSTGAAELAGWLNTARSEAIARHTVVRFMIARQWDSRTNANLRRLSLWAWDAEAQNFFPISKWEELPEGIILEPKVPDYLANAAYAQADPSVVRGDSVLTESFRTAEFAAGTQAEPLSARYIEFLPSGTARVPGSSARRLIYVATPGFQRGGEIVHTTNAGDGRPTDWAQINVDTFTGRARVYLP